MDVRRDILYDPDTLMMMPHTHTHTRHVARANNHVSVAVSSLMGAAA